MAQSLAKVYVHLIFSTKNRKPVLADEIREELHKVMGGALNNMGCQSLIVGFVEDHVHVLFMLSRTRSLSDVIGKLKSTSSSWIKSQNPTLANFEWQAGYGAFSVSHSNVESVREYIRNQKEHHKSESFQDEFRRFLIRYEVEYDERYIWD